MIGDREVAALEAVLRFRGASASLGERIARLEGSLHGTSGLEAADSAAQQGVDQALLDGALLVKGLAAQIDVILHAVGIVQSLPYILEPDERIVSTSLGAGNTGRDWDLETDRQIAEFKFIRWKGRDAIRQNTLFVDLFHLAEANTTKRRVLYVTGRDWPMRFLGGRRRITSVLEKHGGVAASFDATHGDTYAVVSDYWNAVSAKVEIVDLEVLVPGLAQLAD